METLLRQRVRACSWPVEGVSGVVLGEMGSDWGWFSMLPTTHEALQLTSIPWSSGVNSSATLLVPCPDHCSPPSISSPVDLHALTLFQAPVLAEWPPWVSLLPFFLSKNLSRGHVLPYVPPKCVPERTSSALASVTVAISVVPSGYKARPILPNNVAMGSRKLFFMVAHIHRVWGGA